VTLQTALSLSLNTVSVQLTAEVGPAAVAATAHRLGITSTAHRDAVDRARHVGGLSSSS
jgi:penicillin-binding protein 1A